MHRVAITGFGVVSPIGLGQAATWEALAAGRSGVGPATLVPTEDLTIKITAEVKDYDPAAHFERRQISFMDRVSQFAVMAAREAIADSGITFDAALGRRTATVLGCSVGGMTTLDENFARLYALKERVHPFVVPRFMPNAPASHVTMTFGLTGPAFVISSACASSNHAIGVALDMVRAGTAEVALTGGTEASITLGTMKGWEALRIMAPDACRPFSKNRRGMVLGEGAAVFVIERLDRARARGATIHAELAGYGMSSDAKDLTLPDPLGGAAAMRAALDNAGLAPTAIDYINAHGTGTQANDSSETKAIKDVFGDHARALAISATKSMHGHALGGAGAIELASTLLAMRHGVLPPTINLTEPDPECDLDYVPNQARPRPINAALSNSFAFGGLNAVVAVRRAPD